MNAGDPESREVWAPLHAWRALGQLEVEEAVAPLLAYLRTADEDDAAHAELPVAFQVDVRMQAHTAQPASNNPFGTGAGPLCSPNNALHRVLADPTTGAPVDCGRNFLRKDNGYFAFNFAVQRPFHLGERMKIIPKLETFNAFNNKNNVNTVSTPILFNFDGFLRQGVGDPREAQLSLRFEF